MPRRPGKRGNAAWDARTVRTGARTAVNNARTVRTVRREEPPSPPLSFLTVLAALALFTAVLAPVLAVLAAQAMFSAAPRYPCPHLASKCHALRAARRAALPTAEHEAVAARASTATPGCYNPGQNVDGATRAPSARCRPPGRK